MQDMLERHDRNHNILPQNNTQQCAGTENLSVDKGTTTKLSNSDHNELTPPDGGFWAWMAILGVHLTVMNTWGVIHTFGVFQAHYVDMLDRSPSDIAWIGSFEIFLMFFVGAFIGPLTDAGYFRHVTVMGAALIVSGTLAASFSTQYWHFFLAQGVSIGLGNGFMFCPALAILPGYFQRRRSLAIGMSACGSTTGGLAYPLLVRQLLPKIGFSWTMRLICLIQAIALSTALLCLRPLSRKSSSRRRLLDVAALKEMDFALYTAGSFFCYLGSFFTYFYVASYARDDQGLPYTESLNLLIVVNALGTVGRLLPTYLSDKMGVLNVSVPTNMVATAVVYSWIAVSSRSGLYVWSSVAGIAMAASQAMFQSGVASLTSDPSRQGARIGMAFTVVSLAVLAGTPIAGAWVSALDGRYFGAQAFAGSAMLLGTVLLAASREAKRRKVGQGMWAKV